MEFEHLLFKREAEEGEDKEEKKEVGKTLKNILSHNSQFNLYFSSTEHYQES